MRVYIGCFGSGLGHARRMLDVADSLTARGDSVTFSSSGEVAHLIERSGYECNLLPLADVRYSRDGGFSMRLTVESSPALLARTYHQLALEVANITRFGPDVVMSDSALSTLLAARVARVPAFTVLNQLNLGGHQDGKNAALRLLTFGTSTGMGRLWELGSAVLLPDLPPPYTISERNLWGSKVDKTRYIGFLGASDGGQQDDVSREFSSDPRAKVFWQVSGPPGTRELMVQSAISIAKALSDRFVFVVTGGSPGASHVAERFDGGFYYNWCDTPDFYFRSCDVVVARAGHGTISQAIVAGKPALLVPIPNQPEQEGNADKAHRLGVATRVGQAELNPSRVAGALDFLLEPETKRRVRALAEFAMGFDAKSAVLSTIDSLATAGRR